MIYLQIRRIPALAVETVQIMQSPKQPKKWTSKSLQNASPSSSSMLYFKLIRVYHQSTGPSRWHISWRGIFKINAESVIEMNINNIIFALSTDGIIYLYFDHNLNINSVKSHKHFCPPKFYCFHLHLSHLHNSLQNEASTDPWEIAQNSTNF